MKPIYLAILVLAGLAIAPTLQAANISSCAPDFSSCNVFEDGLILNLTGLAISGDVIIADPWNPSVVSDVFRIFNGFFDTGGGTGLGTTAFLYSADLNNLPDPSTYSVNAVLITEGPSIGGGLSQTVYNGGSTVYKIFSSDAAPEPSSVVLFALGAVGLYAGRRRRLNRHQASGIRPQLDGCGMEAATYCRINRS